MNILFRLFNKICFFIGLLAISCVFVLLIAKLTMPAWQFNAAIQTSAAFMKKGLKNDSFIVSNDPGVFEKIGTHIKLLCKMNKGSGANVHTDSICDFSVKFPNYSMLHGQFNEIFVQKSYAFQSQTDTPFIIDAGSNIGISILFFKMIYPNSNIIGFEPSKQYFEMLEDNVKNNNIRDVKVYNVALSNKEEDVKFYNLGSTTGTLNPQVESKDYDFEIIKTDLLSKYINQKVDLLKMDIEGAETDVVTDLFEKNKLDLIDQIIMEYHYIPGKSKLSVMLELLEKSGFSYVIKNSVSTPFTRTKEQQFFLIYAYKNN